MTTQWLPIHSAQASKHGWKQRSTYLFALQDNCAPLLHVELAQALQHYVIAFLARPAGAFELVAVLGLRQNQNLYVASSGQWLAPYIPSQYRGYPFALRPLKSEAGQNSVALYFDHGSGLYREAPDAVKGEERFFNDSGQPEPAVQKVHAFLQQCLLGRQRSVRAVAALASAGLLQPWELAPAEAGTSALRGLHRINEEALAALGADAVHALHQVNALALVYAHIYSLPRLNALKKMAQQRGTAHANLAQTGAVLPGAALSGDGLALPGLGASDTIALGRFGGI